MQEFSYSWSPAGFAKISCTPFTAAGHSGSAWFGFRTEALKRIALNWRQENHIPWE
jgi:hypothetical protein